MKVGFYFGIAALATLLLGGCGGKTPFDMDATPKKSADSGSSSAIPFTAYSFSVLPASLRQQPEPESVEAIYASEPPCKHPIYDEKSYPKSGVCSRQNQEHVSYWTSREDKHRLACKGQPSGYCEDIDLPAANVPHCHGFGAWKYCHAHPGGNASHDHLHESDVVANLEKSSG